MHNVNKSMHKENAEVSERKKLQHSICVWGAREHNLKNIDVAIPQNSLTVITGLSGSGKSSLAFDTIYNEGQRRYMESFSTYARQFIGSMERPDVEEITGLSPVISIEQKTTSKNPRSTVGTVTEVYDFLRLLYARASEAYSYNTGEKMVKFSETEIVKHIFSHFPEKKIVLLAPVVRGRKGHYRELFEEIRKRGYLKARIDGEIRDLTDHMQVDRYKIHDIEIVVDRLQVKKEFRVRIASSIEQCLKSGNDMMMVLENDSGKIHAYSRRLMCEKTGLSYEEPSPNTFSFNSPYGACPHCKGLGSIYSVDMTAVLPDENLTIRGGGIAPLGKERESSLYKLVSSVAKKHKIGLDIPIKKLRGPQLNFLLYGNELGLEKEVADAYEDNLLSETDDGEYEGIIPMIKRWFFSPSSSDFVRQWVEDYMELKPCSSCGGTRLKKESLWFKVDGKNISELAEMNLSTLTLWFSDLESRLSSSQRLIARDILKEIKDRLGFLIDVGLDYLTLMRPSGSLSGGESQRIRLASQIGSHLQGITYILDEPSIGLHQRDNRRLIRSLKDLRDMGNTVIVVEHDRDIMLAADYLIDIGPGAGRLGGHVVFAGPPSGLTMAVNETAAYLTGKKQIPIPAKRLLNEKREIVLGGASGNNLKEVTVHFPLGCMILVTGVSGSGKSTLINETLYPLLMHHCYHSRMPVMPYTKIKGLEFIDKVIEIDQSPIGRSPRSNPATYCGFFTDIRNLFASVPESRMRGYNAGRFSFNVKTGRCDACEGVGMRVIEMNFLPDVYVPCEKCGGKRYNRETLEIRYKGKSISDVLDMTVAEACEFFSPLPSLLRKIKALQDVGLGYLTLGQSALTLSGGEAQRVKLSTELGKKETGNTFYILDEPTTGLHFKDIGMLMDVLGKIVDRGNTVLIIEHNMDVIKQADYIIDLGTEGGDAGGQLLFEGRPDDLMKIKKSYTGRYLKEELKSTGMLK